MHWRIALIGLGGLALAACTNNSIGLDSESAGTAADSANDGAGTVGTDDDSGDDAMDGGPMTTAATSPPPPPPDVGNVDPPPPGVLPTGRYLLVLDTIIEPGTPLQWEVNVDADAQILMGQSLTLLPGSLTDPRDLIGGVWEVPFEFGADGGLSVDVPPLQILGEANPVSGSELVIDFALDGRGEGGFACGSVSGEITSPVKVALEGSTFAMILLADGELYPLDFPLGC